MTKRKLTEDDPEYDPKNHVVLSFPNHKLSEAEKNRIRELMPKGHTVQFRTFADSDIPKAEFSAPVVAYNRKPKKKAPATPKKKTTAKKKAAVKKRKC